MRVKGYFIILVLVLGLGTFATQYGFSQEEENQFLKTGDELYEQDSYTDAIAQYEMALEANAGDFEALWRLSRAYRDRGEIAESKDQEKSDYKTAESYAREAIVADPNRTEGHTQLSAALGRASLSESGRKRVEQSKEIKTSAERAVEIDPNNDTANHILGRWHYEVQILSGVEKFFANLLFGGLPEASYPKAVSYFKKAIETTPDALNNHYELGRTLIKMEEWEEARQEFRTVLDLPTSDPEDSELKEGALKHLREIENK